MLLIWIAGYKKIRKFWESAIALVVKINVFALQERIAKEKAGALMQKYCNRFGDIPE